MTERAEKIVYNITLQSEESDEVKVIDRLRPKDIYLMPEKLTNSMKFSSQFQHGRDDKKEENLLWAVIMLR